MDYPLKFNQTAHCTSIFIKYSHEKCPPCEVNGKLYLEFLCSMFFGFTPYENILSLPDLHFFTKAYLGGGGIDNGMRFKMQMPSHFNPYCLNNKIKGFRIFQKTYEIV